MEQLLHYVWKHKIFPLRELKTTSGLPVEVIDPGLHNMNSGPDFFNAKIKIGEAIWAGNIEIHTNSSDWFRHGHHTNKAYDSVILHVAGDVDADIFRTTGEEIPQMRLPCPEHVSNKYVELQREELKPRCNAILPSLSRLTIHSWFSALQTERFEQKTNVIRERLRNTNNHWEDTFFISLARNFGFGINGDAFETWARQVFFRAVDKHRDNLFQVEALFFGQAGLLEEELTDPHYMEMQKEYRFLRHKFDLKQMDASLWSFSRLRPGNFPHVRIAQLAALYHRQESMFSLIMAAGDIAELREVFSTDVSVYWKDHFSFHKASPPSDKKTGKGARDLLAINTVVPFLYAYGLHKGEDAYCQRATAILEQLKAENNYVTRMWDGVGISVNSAADSQALLQLQKEYCDKKRCLQCRFGFEYLKEKQGVAR